MDINDSPNSIIVTDSKIDASSASLTNTLINSAFNQINSYQANLFEDPEPKPDDPDEDKKLMIIKIVFIFVVFAIAVLFGVLPAKVQRCKNSPQFLGLANAFSGGLFLAIALIHILPEANEKFEEVWGGSKLVQKFFQNPKSVQNFFSQKHQNPQVGA